DRVDYLLHRRQRLLEEARKGEPREHDVRSLVRQNPDPGRCVGRYAEIARRVGKDVHVARARVLYIDRLTDDAADGRRLGGPSVELWMRAKPRYEVVRGWHDLGRRIQHVRDATAGQLDGALADCHLVVVVREEEPP